MLAVLLLTLFRRLFATFGMRCCCLMDSLLSTSTLRSFSAELIYSQLASSMYWCLALFLP